MLNRVLIFYAHVFHKLMQHINVTEIELLF